MAIAIPILLMATEVGAGIAAAVGAAIGVGATTVAIGTGLVLSATGISAKIDKAASKVFGKDLVNFANIAGSIYLAGGAMGAWDTASGSLASAAAGGAGGVSPPPGSLENAAFMEANAGGVMADPTAGVAQANMGLNMDPTATPANQGVTQPTNPNASLKAAKLGTTPAGTGTVDTATQKAAGIWNGLGDRTQAAALQIGGNILSGAAQGKAAQAAEAARIANENRYRSGSGLSYWQQRPSYTPRGG